MDQYIIYHLTLLICFPLKREDGDTSGTYITVPIQILCLTGLLKN